MTNVEATQSGLTGRLAHVLRTRGTSSPERPFVIEHREALIFMLGEAAELEHAILCQYLFAAFSMKQGEDEGVSAEQLAKMRRWRQVILEVAGQEMLHLALVQNLRTAIGASPHLTRPPLPAPARHFPPGVQLALVPFGERALRHFLYLERPEGLEIDDADGFAAVAHAQPMQMDEEDIVPVPQDFATVGHLYRAIEEGFGHLVSKFGEERVFIGPPRAQALQSYFGWPELTAVTDLASAKRALETIVEQGEGSQGDWREAHFGKFLSILEEYLDEREADQTFEPARPVIAANVRPPEIGDNVPLCNVHATAKTIDLFNVSYEILLQTLYRFFAHTEESDAQLMTLADVSVAIMFDLIKPLGDLITRLPVGPDYPGMTAGPSFELFYEADYFFPHQDAAWILLEERLRETAEFARRLEAELGHLSEQMDRVAGAAERLAERLARDRGTPQS